MKGQIRKAVDDLPSLIMHVIGFADNIIADRTRDVKYYCDQTNIYIKQRDELLKALKDSQSIIKQVNKMDAVKFRKVFIESQIMVNEEKIKMCEL